MSRRDNDHIGHTPKMTPAHDEIASYQRSQSKGTLASSLGVVPDVAGQFSSTGIKTLLTLVVLVLLATTAMAGYMFQRLQAAEGSIRNYELRIVDLERQLDVTDESMSESSVAMKVKIREMDSEIRKLWDNVWKKSRERMAGFDAQLEKNNKTIAANQSFVTSAKQQFSKTEDVVASLSSQLKKSQQLQSQFAKSQSTIASQQKSLEQVADKANRLRNEIVQLDRRVKGTEEWVESINGFRRQVNRDLSALKQNVGQMQGGAAP
jgi:methyl-accepting chemotaxis protein